MPVPSHDPAAIGPALYTGVARNDTGLPGSSHVPGGLSVNVTSPVAPERSAPLGETTNPEELLALAWATCLGAAARIVAGAGVDVVAEAAISLHERLGGDGYEFSGHATLRFVGIAPSDADSLAAAAHARCPVSRMLSGTSRVSVAAVHTPD